MVSGYFKYNVFLIALQRILEIIRVCNRAFKTALHPNGTVIIRHHEQSHRRHLART